MVANQGTDEEKLHFCETKNIEIIGAYFECSNHKFLDNYFLCDSTYLCVIHPKVKLQRSYRLNNCEQVNSNLIPYIYYL